MTTETTFAGYDICKRSFDLAFATFALLVFAIPLAVIAIVIRLTSKGPAIHWSRRVGLHNREFRMAKFRTMRIDTPQLPTHLMVNADAYLTPVGHFLRRTSLDELPQLLNIIKGDMSFVGPRPALFNQEDLIQLRTRHDVHTLKPGLTGWAQINGRDELPIPKKVELDIYYLRHRSLLLDLKIAAQTAVKSAMGDGVAH